MLLFTAFFTIKDAVNAGKANNDVDDSFKNGNAAKNSVDQIEVKSPEQSPVDCADNN